METPLENYDKIDYSSLDPNIIGNIAADERKEKYLKYSKSENFFDLDYEVMDAIFRASSAKASDIYTKDEIIGYSTYIDYYGNAYDASFRVFGKGKNNIEILDVETNLNEGGLILE